MFKISLGIAIVSLAVLVPKVANSHGADATRLQAQIEESTQDEADWDTARDMCAESHDCRMLNKLERGE